MANPAPTQRQRTTPASRVEGLPPQAIRWLQQAARGLDQRDLDGVAAALQEAASIAPEHPEILRIRALLEYRRGHFAEAIALLRQTLAAWPDDALALGNLGSAFADSGRAGEALLVLRRATEVAPDQASAWFNLGKVLDSQALVAEAEQAFTTAIARAPRHLSARIAHANTLATLGRTADAAGEYRAALAQDARSVQSWQGLVNLKTIRLEADEAGALERLHGDANLADADRAVAGFALGKVLEDDGRHADAFAVLSAANAVRRRGSPWDARAFSAEVDAIAAAFATEAMPRADDASLGEPVIFVVSLPRSGSTLIEQILAAHPEVEGASELPDLESVILEESARRRQRFPEWVAHATAADWQRMGQRYLQRTARWRKERPRFTDKMPDNWLMVGAALAMLPGARVVNVRRDPVETSWSCFKQLFGAGRHAYSYDLADLAETWHDYDRLCHLWSRRFPTGFREQSYERLLADPENETRALLEFCGLAFDPATLDFHAAERSVRTASAAQVREPLRTDTARSAAYGALLEPLRRMLATTPESRTATGERDPATGAQRGERVQGLADDDAQDLLRAAALLGSERVEQAAPIIERVRAANPGHSEALRLAGALDSARGRHTEALATLQQAAALKPGDALILNTLGTAQAAAGDKKSAQASFIRAGELDPNAAGAHYNLGNLLVARGEIESAGVAFARAVAAEPGFVPARLALAGVLRTLGRDDQAAMQLREALALDPHASAAWESLAELRPAEFTASERSALENEYKRARVSDADRAALAFALANVHEGRAQYPEAFAAFMTANSLRRRAVEWDSARHSRRCQRILDAFPAEPADAPSSALGTGCIFMLGMPDGNADAIARALRAHPAVGRAADPGRVIAAESARRGQRFFEWAAQATAGDWERLGRVYIDRSRASGTHRLLDASSFREELAGAVALMLPAARFVSVRGDALETCWTCFRDDFRGDQCYSYDFSDLAAFWHDQQRLLQRWRERHADRIHVVDAEALRLQPDAEIARLFEFCGIDANVAASPALDLSRARRRVDARAYGELLKPLSGMLESDSANDEHRAP